MTLFPGNCLKYVSELALVRLLFLRITSSCLLSCSLKLLADLNVFRTIRITIIKRKIPNIQYPGFLHVLSWYINGFLTSLLLVALSFGLYRACRTVLFFFLLFLFFCLMFFFLIFIGQNEAYGKTGLIEWSDQAAVLIIAKSIAEIFICHVGSSKLLWLKKFSPVLCSCGQGFELEKLKKAQAIQLTKGDWSHRSTVAVMGVKYCL